MNNKGGNSLSHFNVGGGGLWEPWGVRAFAMMNYWSRGPKATFLFYAPPPCARILRDSARIS